ncbi:MAG: hypothetical protein U5L08_15750 [Xanthomonadales bacterium]|nr:hypothetical protein [Xanthomonadales bacterium]
MTDQTEQHIAEINEKLDRIVRLLAINSIRPDQSMKDKAIALSSVGLGPKEIADLIGSSPHSVSQTLSAAKKTAKKKTKKKAGRKSS